MAADVAPSTTSQAASGPSSSGRSHAMTGPPASAVQVPPPKSPFLFNNNALSPLSIARTPPDPQQYAQSPAQYKSSASPRDDMSSSTSFFSHQVQRVSPTTAGGSSSSSSSTMLLPPPPTPTSPRTSERAVPRGLPPMRVPVTTPPRKSNHSVSPRDRSGIPTSPDAIAQGLNGDGSNPEGMGGDPTAPRKRSKVSRACDECRRKKIRCDASSESGVEQCSSCKRVGSKCSFSRVPMKRGPSKGYIKELADRLNTLENSISTGDLLHPYGVAGDLEHSPGPSDSTSPPPPPGAKPPSSRKRTLSSSSDFQTTLQPLSQPLPQPERLPSIDSFHSQHSQRSLPHPQLSGDNRRTTPTEAPPPQYHSSISPDGTRHRWNGYPDSHRRASVSLPMYTVESQRPSTNLPNSISPEKRSFDWDEESVDQYYSLIHPTFPLLPHSKHRLRQRLATAPITVRDALLEALYAAVRSNPSADCKPNAPPPNPRRACELCVASQFESYDPRTVVPTSLLLLQTMILMTFEADNHGPATLRGHSGPSRATWIGGAIGLAYSLKLHHNPCGDVTAGDLDTDDRLGRRVWWILVVLDRWHAISTSSPLFIPDSSVILLPEDQSLIGATPFHLVRLSCILGHLAEAFTTADEVVSSTTLNPYISRLLRGELERFRESIEVVWGSHSLLHVAYYHVKLLTLRHNSSSEPRQLLEPALRMATMLDHSSMPITPLNHHFAALALITLVDLTDIEETHQEAWRGIQQLSEALRQRRGLATREDSVGWDSAIKDLISKRAGDGNLQHLAELAIADRSPGRPRHPSLDTAKLQRYGYLESILL